MVGPNRGYKLQLAQNGAGSANNRDAGRTAPWFTDAGNVATGSGTGNGQSLTVYGRVPVQTTPVAGTYTDTVVVTITY